MNKAIPPLFFRSPLVLQPLQSTLGSGLITWEYIIIVAILLTANLVHLACNFSSIKKAVSPLFFRSPLELQPFQPKLESGSITLHRHRFLPAHQHFLPTHHYLPLICHNLRLSTHYDLFLLLKTLYIQLPQGNQTLPNLLTPNLIHLAHHCNLS